MEIKFEVSDEMFKEVAENSLKALTPEQLTEICQQAVLEYFRKNNYEPVEKLIVDKGTYGWDYDASNFTKRIIKSCDFSNLQEIVDKCIEQLSNKYDVLLKNIIADMLVTGLTDNYAFREALRNKIREEIYTINNSNRN